VVPCGRAFSSGAGGDPSRAFPLCLSFHYFRADSTAPLRLLFTPSTPVHTHTSTRPPTFSIDLAARAHSTTADY
jgi:hypothetical protein